MQDSDEARAFEAFWSLLLTTYTMPFAAASTWQMLNMVFGIMLSALSLACLLQEQHTLSMIAPEGGYQANTLRVEMSSEVEETEELDDDD